MSDREFQEENLDPSEAELRIMLEERELEKELARKQTSRKFSMILVVSLLTLAAAIFCFPGKPVNVGTAPAARPVIAAPIPAFPASP